MMPTAANALLHLESASGVSASSGIRRRQISYPAGRGLELLAHAIEYLSDEAVERGLDPAENADHQAALAILMRLNREIYFACPCVPTFGERLRSLFRQLA